MASVVLEFSVQPSFSWQWYEPLTLDYGYWYSISPGRQATTTLNIFLVDFGKLLIVIMNSIREDSVKFKQFLNEIMSIDIYLGCAL